MAVILDGRAAASKVMEGLKARAAELRGRGVEPTLALVLVGEDEYSKRYVEMKAKRCEEAGVKAIIRHLPTVTQDELAQLINGLNEDPKIHGVMVQLPLPRELNELATVSAILPEKDVDALSPATLGKILIGEDTFLPAGVEAVMELAREYDVGVLGKHWAVLGLSNIIGKPMIALLANMKVTFTCCQASEPDLAKHTRDADVLVVDVARKWAVTRDMVRQGVVVFDNGNNYEGKKVYGDVDFEGVKELASAITPVPGGIGPLLITMLIRNTLKAAERSTV